MLLAKEAWYSRDRTLSEQDLYSVLSPVTWFCRVTGIFPLRLKGPAGKRKYSTSYILIMYNVTVLVSLVAGLSMWLGIRSEMAKGLWNSEIIMFVTHFEFIAGTLTMVVMIVTAVITKNKVFANAIETLSSQDANLRKLGTRFDYAADLKQNYIRLGINILVMTVLCTNNFFLELDFNLKYPLHWAAWIYPNVIRNATTYLFCDVLFVLRQRFAAVNEHLRKMIEETKYLSPETIFTPGNSSERLRSIARIYGVLYEEALSVNKTFGLHIIIGAICALKMLTDVVCYVNQVMTYDIDIDCMKIVGALSRAMIGAAHIVYLVIACNLTENQASLTGKLIHKFQINEGAKPFNTVLQSFSLQLYHEKIKFSAAGLFPLNATLLHSIVRTVTTYLVISIQIDSSVQHATES